MPGLRFFLRFFVTAVTALAAVLSLGGRAALAEMPHVIVIPVKGTIELGVAAFVERSVAQAEAEEADHIIVDIETFGGRVDAAVRMRDALLDTEIPTTAFVNPRAISAGALISLACNDMYMTPGGTIGAAAPVSGGGPTEERQALGEKEVSYVRTEFRATAESNGYPPLVAEAMVDKDAAVAMLPGPDGPHIIPIDKIETVAKELGLDPATAQTISAAGKLLTLTTKEAVDIGIAKGEAESLDALIDALGYADARETYLHTTWSEDLVRFLTNPAVSGLLLTLGILGLFVEFRVPGWGLPGTFGAIALALFFGGQYLVGLAEIPELLLLGAGLILIALEIFVIPGFGITGIAGMVCVLAAVYLSMVNVPVPRFSWDFDLLNDAMWVFIQTAVTVIVGFLLIWRYLPQSRFGRHLILGHALTVEAGYTGVDETAMPDLGTIATAYTTLRPAGRIKVGDELVDAQTEGGFVESGATVRVIQHLGNAVVVEPVTEEQHGD